MPTIDLFGMCTGVAWRVLFDGPLQTGSNCEIHCPAGRSPVLADAACVPIKIPVGRYLREILDVLLAGNPKKPRD